MVTLASDDLGVWTPHSWYLKRHGERVYETLQSEQVFSRVASALLNLSSSQSRRRKGEEEKKEEGKRKKKKERKNMKRIHKG